MGAAAALRAASPDRAGPAAGRAGTARGRGLDGRGGRGRGIAEPGPLRRSGAARTAARLRDGRPDRDRAVCLRRAADLGTDPSPETAELYTAILRGELPAIAPARGDTTTASLVGRADELAFLDACAARVRGTATAEVVVVDGEPGIGKTSLLRAWASQRAAADDAVLLAACGQLDRSMPLDAVLTSLAALLRRAGDETGAGLLGED